MVLDVTQRRVLKTYWDRGRALRASSEDISRCIEKVITSRAVDLNPKLFFFVEASSGEGKSQFPYSLPMPVVYIPLSAGQSMYRCFEDLANCICIELSSDLMLFGGGRSKSRLDELRATHLCVSDKQLRTVGLLVSLFKALYGRSNAESFKVLSGYDGQLTVEYVPMTLESACESLAMFVKEHSTAGVSATSAGRCAIPLFVVDEVPAASPDATHYESLNP